MVSAFEGNEAETEAMLQVVEMFTAAHHLPDVTVRPQPESDNSRSRNIEANPAASSFNGGQGVLPVLAVEGALGRHATSGLRGECLRGDAAAIGKLIRNWGEGYVVSYANVLYHAERRDNGAQVHAPDRETQEDYTARPVPRVLRPG